MRLGPAVTLAALLAAGAAQAQDKAAAPGRPPTSAQVLEGTKAEDWRLLDPASTLYMDVGGAAGGRVVIELAPHFAPRHVDNIRALARDGFFDGVAIVRVQENYVTQWGDPDNTKPIAPERKALAPEFTRKAAGLDFARLPDPDAYAPETGHSAGFPAARDPGTGEAWLVHCYAMVGAGRDMTADSGSGAELYAMIGHAPRHLDRNMTLVGRVVQGMEHLSALPRGTGALGFYEKPEQRVPVTRVRLAADLPAAERVELEALRTDTAAFAAYVESRRNRREEFFLTPLGGVDVCNVPLPVRPRKK
ncbi:MAG TPA: peptidylprolyl isomerase [Azospirillaceae bacterium]|nr:peptidylprolyl isomerase [Azospirillaceae bacterium]